MGASGETARTAEGLRAGPARPLYSRTGDGAGRRSPAIAVARAACAATLLVLAACGSEPAEAPRGQVVSAGVYGVAGATAASAEAPVRAAAAALQTATDTVEARPGVNFGFEYTVTGLPTDRPATLELVVRHPPMRFDDGTTRSESRGAVRAATTDGSYHNMFLYRFDRPDDLVPGDWTLQVSGDGRVLVERRFHVRLPDT